MTVKIDSFNPDLEMNAKPAMCVCTHDAGMIIMPLLYEWSINTFYSQ